ncbi:DegT/DnrJ/EryC1/StrS family aminotransferase [Galbibacter pacificus]|uniref:Aminotransferase class I/II-fold pyridoxal phosphate-dependent enzyme n=1 Tax=Galbibacter pacificus TaxID=2996052 RepID=A0ABT6FR91_9FLAO|nr:aminotransferase class I/II-fold pyridoxal phosphate-dependent enzyme [Galbibacter pacificus]MDG3581741.1 aminotransferase class I/II-fold pyridoxal phosphate-dependent enzyme [Galbibacter pacificus]MDG3585785.1 aminotransferase class I/II-fold pyridoxal phosphate-dependent enzyme [Galbibacter pacificus]
MIATNKKIWLSSPHLGGTEQKYVAEAFSTNWVAPLGPNVDAFEEAIALYLKEDVHVAAVASGTSAIHLALVLLGVGPGDDVLCQSFTFSASANPILYQGANPIFIDSEADTWNISAALLEEAIIKRIQKNKKPKAIVAVHLYGMPYDALAINQISKKYNIPVIEDSAEALGSEYLGIKCGTLGDISILSFNGNKIITTSGGGALVTQNKELKKKAVFLATQARDNAPHYQHSVVGYNYRMSNVVAGIGRGQMEVLNDRVLARRKNYQYYRERLENIPGIYFLREPEGTKSNRWLTTILLNSYEERERVRLCLENENIDSRPLWKPMHLQPVFKNALAYTNGVSEMLFDRGLCLPSGSNLVEEDLEKVTNLIKNTLLR